MSTKFAVIGVVTVLGAGAIMHHARFCPLRAMMTAMHHQTPKTLVAKAPVQAPASSAMAKTAGTVAFR